MRLFLVIASLIGINLAAWGAGLQISNQFPFLLSSMALAYSLGLRHAFDADHIAAIDNVTRRLLGTGERPVAVGFLFSLGHSTVVGLAVLGSAMAAAQVRPHLAQVRDLLAPFATVFSSAFLVAIAGFNILVLVQVWRRLRRYRSGAASAMDEDIRIGRFTSWLDGLLRRVNRSWLMFPIGFIFALGFDTATEVSLLGLSAAQAARGLPLLSILVFPALFASGMALADTLEGWLMVGVYHWSSRRPGARLYYNVTVTAASVLIGLAIAGGQLAGLAPVAVVGSPIGALLQEHSSWIGGLIVLIFGCAWMLWALCERLQHPVATQPRRRPSAILIERQEPAS